MARLVFGLVLAGVFLPARAFDHGPAISITSPDQGSTYAYATIKQHTLIWDKRRAELFAHVVFAPVYDDSGAAQQDSYDFRLPGVSFDPASGTFFAMSVKGKTIPVARIHKAHFLSTIETLPNAVVRIVRLHGDVSVVMEAIDPQDPAMRAPPPEANPDGSSLSIPLNQIVH